LFSLTKISLQVTFEQQTGILSWDPGSKRLDGCCNTCWSWQPADPWRPST